MELKLTEKWPNKGVDKKSIINTNLPKNTTIYYTRQLARVHLAPDKPIIFTMAAQSVVSQDLCLSVCVSVLEFCHRRGGD